MEDPVVPLERNLVRSFCDRTIIWERQFENVLWKHEWEKVPNWLLVCERRKKRLYLSVCADDIKVTGKTNDIEPT